MRRRYERAWSGVTEMRKFLVCLHDVTPAYARETRVILRNLAPLVGRRLALGVVPNWNRQWHLTGHPDYCRVVRESAEELLLHGYFHRRLHGWGPTSWLAEGSDEMNGLDPVETRTIVERGQRVFTEVFGEPARGFLAPAWRRGHVRALGESTLGLEYVLGFFSLESRAGPTVRLTTWSWDCGRWAWLGHIGHAIGRLSHCLQHGVPTVAIHPRDLERGFWPRILRLTQELLDAGYEPSTAAGLLAVIPSTSARVSGQVRDRDSPARGPSIRTTAIPRLPASRAPAARDDT